MQKILQFFHDNKLAAIAISVVYFFLVTLPHEEVGKFIAAIFEDSTRDRYNAVVLCLSIVGMAGYLLYLYSNVRRQSGFSKKLIVFYFAVTLLLIVVSFKLLIIVNIEAIHFVQYAVMAIFLFPLVRRYGETLFWVTLLGAIDEAFQYFYLSPERTDYYDFNDDIINLIGGALGLLLVRAVQPGFTLPPRKNVFRSPVFFTTVGIAVLTIIALQMDWLYVEMPEDAPNAFWSLIRVPTEGFWTTVHPNVTYHVVQPMEGVVIMGLLLWFYSGLRRE